MNRTAFEQVAYEWHHEKYVVLTRAQPARADEVAAWLRNHLFPFMDAHDCTSGEQVTRQMFLGFQDWVADPARVDSGPAPANPDEMLTVGQAVQRTGVSASSVKRRLRTGGFPNAVQQPDRRWLIPMGDLHSAGLLGAPLRRGPRSLPKNHQQQAEMRKVLADILAFGQDLGRWTLQFDPSTVPLKLHQTPQPLRRQLTLREAAAVAGRLHVVHQFALWLMRILGLRKSEAYGLQVGDIQRVDGRMFLFVRRQGGRRLKQFAEDGSVITGNFKPRLKTSTSVRMLLVPRPMETMIDLVVSVFHTVDGMVQENHRLIPGLRAGDVGGGNSFGIALREAAFACSINVSLDPDAYLGMLPKDLRADLITDLASEDVAASVRKRYAGHIAGDDVHDRRYVRATATQVRKQLAAAEAMEELIDVELDGVLMVPTAMSCTTANQPALAARKQQVDGGLVAAGWLRNHVDGQGRPMLTSEQVADMFGVSLAKVRQWAREERAVCTFDGQRYLFNMKAMVELARDLAGYVSVRDLTAELGLADAHHLRYRMQREGIEPCSALPGMLQMLTPADAQRLRELVGREQQTRARCATFEEAAQVLQVSAGLIPVLVDGGLLTLDAQTHAGQAMVTRESLQALAERSVIGGRGRAS